MSTGSIHGALQGCQYQLGRQSIVGNRHWSLANRWKPLVLGLDLWCPCLIETPRTDGQIGVQSTGHVPKGQLRLPPDQLSFFLTLVDNKLARIFIEAQKIKVTRTVFPGIRQVIFTHTVHLGILFGSLIRNQGQGHAIEGSISRGRCS